MTKIAIGSDHAGFALKGEIINYLAEKKITYADVGCYTEESADYPLYANKVCHSVLSGECEMGVLLCTTGIGMSIAANRFKGIRAALCHSARAALAARDHNDANILVMGANAIATGQALEICAVFLNTEFSSCEKHMRRLHMIDGGDIKRYE